MTAFCTKTKTDILKNSNDKPTALYNILYDLGPKPQSGPPISDFYKVFANDTTLLPPACGLNQVIYQLDQSNNYSFVLPKNITINYDTVQTFWASSGNVENFASNFSNVFSNLFSTKSSQNPNNTKLFSAVFDKINDLLSIIFYDFFCVQSSQNAPLADLTPNNPLAQSVDNFRKFFTLVRGAGSLMVCDLCMTDYFQPLTVNNESTAGAIVRKAMSNDPTLRKWCGCCIPQEKDKPEKGYNFLNPFTQDSVNYPLECEPSCNVPIADISIVPFSNNNYTIPLIRGDSLVVNAPINNPNDPVVNDSYTIAKCNANVCVIDNINVDVVASRGDGITFNQVCPGCDAGNPCICYSYGKGVYDKIKANSDGGMTNPVIFKQNCPNAFCYAEQADGSYQEVKCNTSSPANTGKGSDVNHEGTGTFKNLQEADVYGIDTWLFPISLLAVFIIFFLGAIFTTLYRNRVEPNKKQDSDKEKKKTIVI